MPKVPQARISRARRDSEQQHATISASKSITTPSPKPNAFDELMKPRMQKNVKIKYPRENTWGRDGPYGLGGYITDPEQHVGGRVLSYNERFVIVKDKYPKADIHLLVMPRDPKKTRLVPQDAFEDADFLEDCRREVAKARHMVAEELRRRYGRLSKTEQPRLAAMESEDLPDELPSGRDWEAHIISGIHSRPSMQHIHIHVLSPDMVNDRMQTDHHYQSFNSKFLVPLDQFPMARDDIRTPQGQECRHTDYDVWLNGSLVRCWRCDKAFPVPGSGKSPKNLPQSFKAHLAMEFEQWKRE